MVTFVKTTWTCKLRNFGGCYICTSLNSTDTPHKAQERFTMLTDIQLAIYDTTIVRIIADINTF